MTYEQTVKYLLDQLPMYQRVGASAYKKDLANIVALSNILDNPQDTFPSIHIAGTNGKGSVAFMLSAILQAAGYKTGLYISPHYKDFRERIRINGEYISETFVTDFVEKMQTHVAEVQPSFFETTVAMAFDYFAHEKVDIAVIETGLGGRLDSTNIIKPILSIITNISLDHTDLLGETLPEIAAEKAGIIKPGVPVVIGEEQAEIKSVFTEKAKELNAPIVFASRTVNCRIQTNDFEKNWFEVDRTDESRVRHVVQFFQINLNGSFQEKNIATVFKAWESLEKYTPFRISEEAFRKGLENLKTLTNFIGRWQKIGNDPVIICDSGHNEGGLNYTMQELSEMTYNRLHIVVGMVKDKDITKSLQLFPRAAVYYFAKADIPRGMDAEVLKTRAAEHGLVGDAYSSIPEALKAAKIAAAPDDLIFVGGSTFVVAEVL